MLTIRDLTVPRIGILLLITTICLQIAILSVEAAPAAPRETEALELVAHMERAYGKVSGYQAEMEVREYRKGKYVESKRFRYRFRKPNQLRIDMHSPKPGTILVYPDSKGKVTLRPYGWGGLATLHLATDSAMLSSGHGQRIDQSDFGLLISNIRRSVTDKRRGELVLSGTPELASIEVLADDHFLPGVVTRYRFVIDKKLWLPREVHESTPEGLNKRSTIFGSLNPSATLNDDTFKLE